MLLDEITAEDIQNWQNKMYEKNYEPTYLRSIANQLSGMMNHACNIYDMHTSPYRKIRKMGKADANRIDFWTFDEYQRFIQEMKDDPIYFPLFETLYYTGMREGELLALSKDMIDLANNIIHIRKTFPMEDLNYDTIHGYRNSHRSLKEGHPFERLSDQEYLRSIGAAAISDEDGKLHPTAAGMLMFGDEYNIVRHFPEYFLDYREELDPTTRWSDRLQSSSGEWSGNVCDFYFRVYNKIIKDIKVPFKMVGGERVDDTPVHKALREALANCLINADYHGLRGVVIRKEPDKLVLANPGYVRTGKKQMRLGGESDPRNKALMKMFNLINIGERAGSGVPNIFNVWADEGWEEPVIEERFDPDRTVLSLSFKKSGDKKPTIKSDDKKKISKTQLEQEQILLYMKENREYKLQDFCELLSLKESRVKTIIKPLIDEGEIVCVGANKDRRYLKGKDEK